jgi:hypothetical protein
MSQRGVVMSDRLSHAQQKGVQHLGLMVALCALEVCQKHCGELGKAEHILLVHDAAQRAEDHYTVTLAYHDLL